MKSRFILYCPAILCVMTLLVVGLAGLAQSQTVKSTAQWQEQQTAAWTEIQNLKSSGGDIPAALYDRYFEAERALNPEENTGRTSGSLDQGVDACPGLEIVQPVDGDLTFTDYGETYLAHDDCQRCRPSKDLVYKLVMNHAARLQISTCGSGFDTYLCVYRDSCCTPAAVPVFYNDDAPAICGAHSLKAAINACFLVTGTYYVILDGYNIAAAGHYVFNITTIPDIDCSPVPHFACPSNYLVHHEGPDEAVCEQGMDVNCGDGVCGIIDALGDLDVFRFTLTQCEVVTLSIYGNDTPGRSGFAGGLDPIGRLFAGPGCDHPLFVNDNYNGTVPAPVGNDSRVITTCLRPATYWFEVGGNTSTGSYEFTIDCTPCSPGSSVGGLTVDRGNGDHVCVDWPAGQTPEVYYVWRLIPNQQWTLAGNTPHPPYCETVQNGQNAVYQVFTDPCGIPSVGQ